MRPREAYCSVFWRNMCARDKAAARVGQVRGESPKIEMHDVSENLDELSRVKSGGGGGEKSMAIGALYTSWEERLGGDFTWPSHLRAQDNYDERKIERVYADAWGTSATPLAIRWHPARARSRERKRGGGGAVETDEWAEVHAARGRKGESPRREA